MPSGEREHVVCWLLDGDPAVRWQVIRDLTGGSPADVAAERAPVAHKGWGADLLSVQDADGRWAGALYSPKWTSTTYTLLLLQWLGLPAGNPSALAGCGQLWNGAGYFSGGLNMSGSARLPEACVTGMLVLIAASFKFSDHRVDPAVQWLLGQQLPDGGPDRSLKRSRGNVSECWRRAMSSAIPEPGLRSGHAGSPQGQPSQRDTAAAPFQVFRGVRRVRGEYLLL